MKYNTYIKTPGIDEVVDVCITNEAQEFDLMKGLTLGVDLRSGLSSSRKHFTTKDSDNKITDVIYASKVRLAGTMTDAPFIYTYVLSPYPILHEYTIQSTKLNSGGLYLITNHVAGYFSDFSYKEVEDSNILSFEGSGEAFSIQVNEDCYLTSLAVGITPVEAEQAPYGIDSTVSTFIRVAAFLLTTKTDIQTNITLEVK